MTQHKTFKFIVQGDKFAENADLRPFAGQETTDRVTVAIRNGPCVTMRKTNKRAIQIFPAFQIIDFTKRLFLNCHRARLLICADASCVGKPQEETDKQVEKCAGLHALEHRPNASSRFCNFLGTNSPLMDEWVGPLGGSRGEKSSSMLKEMIFKAPEVISVNQTSPSPTMYPCQFANRHLDDISSPILAFTFAVSMWS